MKFKIAIALGALSIVGGAIAQAQQPAPSPEVQAARAAMREACAADMTKLCADKQGREAFMCLRENMDKASQPCKDAAAKAQAAARPAG
jgi:hypothetical protein